MGEDGSGVEEDGSDAAAAVGQRNEGEGEDGGWLPAWGKVRSKRLGAVGMWSEGLEAAPQQPPTTMMATPALLAAAAVKYEACLKATSDGSRLPVEGLHLTPAFCWYCCFRKKVWWRP